MTDYGEDLRNNAVGRLRRRVLSKQEPQKAKASPKTG